MYRLTHCWAFRIVLVHCKHHFTLEKEPKFIFIFYYFIHSQQACFVFLSSTWHVKVKSNEPCRRSCGTWPNKWDQTNVPKQGVILFSVNRLQLAKKSHVLLWKKLASNSIFHTQWGGGVISLHQCFNWEASVDHKAYVSRYLQYLVDRKSTPPKCRYHDNASLNVHFWEAGCWWTALL